MPSTIDHIEEIKKNLRDLRRLVGVEVRRILFLKLKLTPKKIKIVLIINWIILCILIGIGIATK